MLKLRALLTILFLGLCVIALAEEDTAVPLAIDLANYEYPFPVSTLQLKAQQQDLTMAFMDVAPEKPNGRTVLLLHGKNFNGAYWRSTISALTQAGYRVVVPDQIGFGKSTKPQHFQYSFHQLAQNTKVLLNKLKIKEVAVMGHSMGGMLAARFALMYPEATTQLILLNPIGLEDYKLKVPYQGVNAVYEQELKSSYAAIKQYQMQNYYDGQWKPEYDEWARLLAGWTRHPDYPLIAWNAALTYDMIFTQPVVYELEKILAPTLLIIGNRDRTALGKALASEPVRKTLGHYSQLGRSTRQRMINAELVELEGIGHLPHIEAFERFLPPLLRFLGQTPRPGVNPGELP